MAISHDNFTNSILSIKLSQVSIILSMMSYTRPEKLKAVLYAEVNGNWTAGHLFEHSASGTKTISNLTNAEDG